MQTAKWMLTIALAASGLSSTGIGRAEGLTPNVDTLPWSRWQARVALGAAPPAWRAGWGERDRPGLKVATFSLMGDYYFARSLHADGMASGFRATSGLIVGPRSALWTGRPATSAWASPFSVDRRLFDMSYGAAGTDTGDSGTLPYLGIGYSGLSPRGGWSFSADLGMVAFTPGNAVKLGRVVSGSQGLDELLRDLRLSPVIQFGVSYSF
jgi:hypothetical protein